MFWCLSIRIIIHFYSSQSPIYWRGPHRPTFTLHKHQGTDDPITSSSVFLMARLLIDTDLCQQRASSSHSHIAFKAKCSFVVTYILQLWLKDTWCNVLLMSVIKMFFLICVRLRIVLIIHDDKTDGQNQNLFRLRASISTLVLSKQFFHTH